MIVWLYMLDFFLMFKNNRNCINLNGLCETYVLCWKLVVYVCKLHF